MTSSYSGNRNGEVFTVVVSTKTTKIKVLSQELTEQNAGLNLLQYRHHLLNVVFLLLFIYCVGTLVVLQLSRSI